MQATLLALQPGTARTTGSSSGKFRPCCRAHAAHSKLRCNIPPADTPAKSSSCSTDPSRRQLLGAAAGLGALLSLQRPASAAGAVPKAYEDTAQKLVDALREAISTDLSDAEEREVRRAADPAKNLVREFLTRWKGNALVEGEESYRQLTSAIQQLGQFYQQNGQRARLSSQVGQSILDTLDAAEAALPPRDSKPSLLPFL